MTRTRIVTSRDKRSTDRPLWLHLETRHTDVLALARMHSTWRALLTRGWAVEDLGQEVLVRVLSRQEEHQPYDGTRAGMAKYLVTLTGSILLNLLEGTRTLKAASEELGAVLVVDGEATVVDAALVAVGELRPALSERAARALERGQEAEHEASKAARKGSRRARGGSRGPDEGEG